MDATTDIVTSNSLADLAARIRQEHKAALLNLKRGLEHAIAAGKLLIEAQDALPHGQWLPWLRENFPDSLPERTASHYMRLARHAPDLAKSATVADLTVRGALELLASGQRALTGISMSPYAERGVDLRDAPARRARAARRGNVRGADLGTLLRPRQHCPGAARDRAPRHRIGSMIGRGSQPAARSALFACFLVSDRDDPWRESWKPVPPGIRCPVGLEEPDSEEEPEQDFDYDPSEKLGHFR